MEGEDRRKRIKLEHLVSGAQIIDELREVFVTGDAGASPEALLADLKRINRTMHLYTKQQKDACNERKQTLDREHLRLENLQYERNHLAEQIRRIRTVRYRYQEIDFAAGNEAPAGETLEQQRERMLRLLEAELQERTSLAAEVNEAQQRRDALAAMTVAKRQFLDKLAQRIGGLLKECDKVRTFLGTDKLSIKELLPFLPAPLATLATALQAAVSDHRASCSLELVGDAAAARTWQPPVVEAESSRRSSRAVQPLAEDIFPLQLELRVQADPDTLFVFSFMYVPLLNAVAVAETLPPGRGAASAPAAADETAAPSPSEGGARLAFLACLVPGEVGAPLDGRAAHLYPWLKMAAGLAGDGPQPGEDAHRRAVRGHVEQIVARCRTAVALDDFCSDAAANGSRAVASRVSAPRQVPKSVKLRGWREVTPPADAARAFECVMSNAASAQVRVTFALPPDYPARMPSVTAAWHDEQSGGKAADDDAAPGEAATSTAAQRPDGILRAMEDAAVQSSALSEFADPKSDLLVVAQTAALIKCLHVWERNAVAEENRLADKSLVPSFDLRATTITFAAVAAESEPSAQTPAPEADREGAPDDDAMM